MNARGETTSQKTMALWTVVTVDTFDAATALHDALERSPLRRFNHVMITPSDDSSRWRPWLAEFGCYPSDQQNALLATCLNTGYVLFERTGPNQFVLHHLTA